MLRMVLVLAAALLGLGALGLGGEGGPLREAAEYVKVEVKGRLRTGVMAIGGETTGVEIAAKGVTWELDFGDRRDLLALAEKLDGKTVVVTGTLEVREGVEVRRRTIVTVTSLRAAS